MTLHPFFTSNISLVVYKPHTHTNQSKTCWVLKQRALLQPLSPRGSRKDNHVHRLTLLAVEGRSPLAETPHMGRKLIILE